MPKPIARTPQSRVFIIEGGAAPTNVPQYLDYARALGNAWPQGDITPIRVPSASAYDQFDIVDEIQGQQGLPSNSIEFRSVMGASKALEVVRKRCLFDVQIHQGSCKDPTDFNGGWDVIWTYLGARATSFSTDELGAMDSGQNASIMETLPFTARDLFQILPLVPALIGSTQITDEIVDITICDSKTCGECGLASDGCKVSFAIQSDTSGSPGLPAELNWTNDGWATVNSTTVPTMGLTDTPDALLCVGSYLVVITNSGGGIHYAPIRDIVAGTASWTKNVAGFVASKMPNDAFSLGSTKTWFVGNGGYIYFTDDISGTMTVQTSGGVSTQNLNAIHGVDDDNLVAVGASNAVLHTANGGATWESITGPAVGVALNAIWMVTHLEWLVGTAGGKLFYTLDGGTSWTEKTFPGSGAGSVRDLVFANAAVGYMAHDTATPRGRILRTINGGQSWYVLPERGTAMPSVNRFNAIAACEEDPNVVYVGGLATDGNDGVLIKLS